MHSPDADNLDAGKDAVIRYSATYRKDPDADAYLRMPPQHFPIMAYLLIMSARGALPGRNTSPSDVGVEYELCVYANAVPDWFNGKEDIPRLVL